ncbi:hypothetical protein [Chryseobacterium sp.]|jgi:hypothetical protein|uniref:hypothetical protein n=1 Tax=Chryseobacterium sp. TaxID=1871047 RepID=UPI002FCB934C
MKKYIKILGLFIVVIMQSCENSSTDLVSEVQSDVILNLNEVDAKTYSREGIENSGIADLDTGDDDEPKRDKSHWRIAKDTITK